jgi:hypothetical protein
MSEKTEDILLIERLLCKRTTAAISPLSIALLIFILFIIWFQTIIPWIINPNLNQGLNYSNFGQNQGLNRDYFRGGYFNQGLNRDYLNYFNPSLNQGFNQGLNRDYLL